MIAEAVAVVEAGESAGYEPYEMDAGWTGWMDASEAMVFAEKLKKAEAERMERVRKAAEETEYYTSC